MNVYIRCVDGCRHIRELLSGQKACYRYPGQPEGHIVKAGDVTLAEQVYPLVTDDTIACGEFQRPDWRVKRVLEEQEAKDAAA